VFINQKGEWRSLKPVEGNLLGAGVMVEDDDINYGFGDEFL